MFCDLWEDLKHFRVGKEDENKNGNYSYSLYYYNKAIKKEPTIRKLWGEKCQSYLSGILIYMYKLDPYFNPHLHTPEQFFIKVYRHRDILTKIGRGTKEIIYPFVNFVNKEKNILLIRC